MAKWKPKIAAPRVEAPSSRLRTQRDDDLLEKLWRDLHLGRGSVGLRIGFDPLSAIAEVSEGVDFALARLDVAAKVGRAWPEAPLNPLALAAARLRFDRALDEVTPREAQEALRRLRANVGDVPALASPDRLLDAARREAADQYPLRPGRAPGGTVPKSTAFDVLERAADASDEIELAHWSFERALATFDPNVIRDAGDSLQRVLAERAKKAGLKARDVQRAKRAIATVVRTFERQVPGPTADAIRDAVRNAVAGLATSAHPVNDAYGRLSSWFSEPAKDLDKVTIQMARIPRVAGSATGKALEDAVRWRVETVKGLLGEVVARNSAYRRVYSDELNRAERFVDAPGGARWKLMPARTPIRALTKDKTRFALSYDDSILLVDEQNKKVAVVLAAQFKAGDASSLTALAQTKRDIVREQGGQLLIDGIKYDIELGTIRTRRAVVGTQFGGPPDAPRPVGEELSTLELDVILMRVDPKDLRAFAAFILEAAGIIPASR